MSLRIARQLCPLALVAVAASACGLITGVGDLEEISIDAAGASEAGGTDATLTADGTAGTDAGGGEAATFDSGAEASGVDVGAPEAAPAGFCADAGDGVACGSNGNACQHLACKGGGCSLVVNDDGKACGANNPCHSSTCSKGTCVTNPPLPDGTHYGGDPLDRCCEGNPDKVNSAQNCGACGIDCGNEPCINAHGGHWYCQCATSSACWSGCCANFYGNPWVCAATSAANCAAGGPLNCPGNATDTNGFPSGPYYCHY